MTDRQKTHGLLGCLLIAVVLRGYEIAEPMVALSRYVLSDECKPPIETDRESLSRLSVYSLGGDE